MPGMKIADFRGNLVAWLDAHADELRAPFEGYGSLDLQMEQFRRVKRALFDADWGRYGWPESAGGLGGSPILRAIVGEEVAFRDLADPGPWSMIEVLAPTVIAFGASAITSVAVPAVLRGDEIWCQGFSEPGTGSDLASLSCRATPTDGGWLINGQKVWTSFVQYAKRCVLLTRTGEPGSAHRGITAFFVDVDSPGLTYRPIEIQSGRFEFAEVFYDDVFVPADRMLGDVGQGWQVAMDVLPYERSTTFWQRGAYLYHRLGDLVSQVASGASGGLSTTDGVHSPADDAKALGEAFQAMLAFRCRSRETQHRLAAGGQLGAETSIDKILVAGAEQLLFETVRDLLPGVVEFDDDPEAGMWRMEYLYSKAATIYGGTAEIQRNIVARRLLDLGAET
jgi:alkylation response protein AidB-like acyl-CoA dehydrogenase